MGLPESTSIGSPDDIASWVSYVASPQSQFLTGRHNHFERFQSLRSDIATILKCTGQTTILDGGFTLTSQVGS